MCTCGFTRKLKLMGYVISPEGTCPFPYSHTIMMSKLLLLFGKQIDFLMTESKTHSIESLLHVY